MHLPVSISKKAQRVRTPCIMESQLSHFLHSMQQEIRLSTIRLLEFLSFYPQKKRQRGQTGSYLRQNVKMANVTTYQCFVKNNSCLVTEQQCFQKSVFGNTTEQFLQPPKRSCGQKLLIVSNLRAPSIILFSDPNTAGRTFQSVQKGRHQRKFTNRFVLLLC